MEIIERLRRLGEDTAADEITRLRAERDTLVTILEEITLNYDAGRQAAFSTGLKMARAFLGIEGPRFRIANADGLAWTNEHCFGEGSGDAFTPDEAIKFRLPAGGKWEQC
jgi:hypothetical protein